MTAVRYFDADYIDRIQEFVLLANRLPRGGGQPTEARCSTCRASLGAPEQQGYRFRRLHTAGRRTAAARGLGNT